MFECFHQQSERKKSTKRKEDGESRGWHTPIKEKGGKRTSARVVCSVLPNRTGWILIIVAIAVSNHRALLRFLAQLRMRRSRRSMGESACFGALLHRQSHTCICLTWDGPKPRNRSNGNEQVSKQASACLPACAPASLRACLTLTASVTRSSGTNTCLFSDSLHTHDISSWNSLSFTSSCILYILRARTKKNMSQPRESGNRLGVFWIE